MTPAAGGSASSGPSPPVCAVSGAPAEAAALRLPCEPPRWGFKLCRSVVRMLFVMLVRGRVFHADRVPATGGVMLVCNHQSYFDPPLAGLALRRECAFLARDSLFRRPGFARLIRYLNAIPVRRGSADVTALKSCLRCLNAGRCVVTFPEGTRTRDGTIGPFLLGPLLMAKRAGVPIVPVVVVGAYESWPRGQRLPRLHRISVYYGRPLTAAQVAAEAAERLAEMARAEMVRIYERATQTAGSGRRGAESRQRRRAPG